MRPLTKPSGLRRRFSTFSQLAERAVSDGACGPGRAWLRRNSRLSIAQLASRMPSAYRSWCIWNGYVQFIPPPGSPRMTLGILSTVLSVFPEYVDEVGVPVSDMTPKSVGRLTWASILFRRPELVDYCPYDVWRQLPPGLRRELAAKYPDLRECPERLV